MPTELTGGWRAAGIFLALVSVTAPVVTISNPSQSGIAGAAKSDTRAAALLAAVRNVLGGPRLAAVRSLHLEGDAQDIGEYSISQVRNVLAVLPADFLTTDRNREFGWETGWGIRDGRFFWIGAPGVSLLPKEQAAAVEQGRASHFRREATRYLVALLLTTETPVPIGYAYGGRAQASDGMAEILDLTWAEDLTARLFVDADTKFPLMMSFDELQIRAGPRPSSFAELKPKMPEWERVPQALYFSDYRRVDGVMMPHGIIHTVAGKTRLQWTITRVRVNPKGLLNSFPK